jgi:hypothetical protein
MSMMGIVRQVDGQDIRLDTGYQVVAVNTAGVEQEGQERPDIAPGDAVTVYGKVPDNLFETLSLDAVNIVKLSDAGAVRTGQAGSDSGTRSGTQSRTQPGTTPERSTGSGTQSDTQSGSGTQSGAD